MPRPIRIEYEDAFYHVMNRGAAKRDVFHERSHYLNFLKILEESCDKFGCIVHAYCLMPNHYHLLIQTPNANLSKVMKYIGSSYTQQFNKYEETDGAIFRGRYKSILVEDDDYLMELTKYIHRNPIVFNLDKLSDYGWSSYPYYLNLYKTPNWLCKNVTLSKLEDDDDLEKSYQLFVEYGINKEIEELFDKKNRKAILKMMGK